MNVKRLIIAGGGAAGFFSAIAAAEHGFNGEIILLEKSQHLLSKVLVSGGGRCNVTHACFENSLLVQNYPRGEKELRGPFSVFNPKQTIAWFNEKGVSLKTENDGRIFPVSDRSQTIADCLLNEAAKHHVQIKLQAPVIQFIKNERFEIELPGKQIIACDYLLLATGGHPKPEGYHWITKTGHHIASPVPSLFTFNVPDSLFKGLEGISIAQAKLSLLHSKFKNTGPLLITHWGLSGPGILKLSAMAARWLNEQNYTFEIRISFLPGYDEESLRQVFQAKRNSNPSKKIMNDGFHEISSRLWIRLCELSFIDDGDNWGQVKKEKINKLVQNLCNFEISVKGKTTFKEEFVTCGGINLKEINLQTMESKLIPGLYFAGELIDVDGVTGGFNFQNAWTTGWIAGKAIAEKVKS